MFFIYNSQVKTTEFREHRKFPQVMYVCIFAHINIPAHFFYFEPDIDLFSQWSY